MLSLSHSFDLNEEQDSISVATSDTDSERNEVIESYNEQPQPTFGNIKVENSTDIHFGNKTYYQGPVTVKQIVYTKPELPIVGENKDRDIAYNGNDNKCFVLHNDEIKLTDNKDNVQDTNPSTTKGLSWIQNFSHQHLLVVISLAAVLLVSLVTLLTVLSTRSESPNIFTLDSNEQDKGTPSEYPVDENYTLIENLTIITRKEWEAEDPKEQMSHLVLPVPYVIIMHTATESCADKETCIFYVKTIQKFHMYSRGWADIGYSFMVGGDGRAYVGRGWNAIGAQVYGYNDKCIGIAFIGTFNQILPPPIQMTAAQKIIEMGLSNNIIASDYKLLAARQLQTTQSPGEALYEYIKNWNHWSPTP